jgi:hypothetical protein
MNLAAGTIIFDTKITSISGGTDVYVCGSPLNVFQYDAENTLG